MGVINNIGPTDRSVRLAVGVLLVAIGLANVGGVISLGVVGGVALLVGAVLIGTGLLRTCLLYRVVGIDTSQGR
ncbi:YgaP family membrane protein [Halobellus ordinarius]|uniref:YgaP family membrane protein n=1 Tax=Halobellus ordinarius TaxID=3075120 RepID=UPI00287FFD0F|nr:DUF2892 domain-containing protein [Halobellus sp. ZY16]